jgi:uncharacterized protein involved in exopolysaccharide biosynthesis
MDYGSQLRIFRDMGPLAVDVQRLEVMREVRSRLGRGTSSEWLVAHTRAEPVAEQRAIRISVEDVDPVRAERIVQKVRAVFVHEYNAAQQQRLREEETGPDPNRYRARGYAGLVGQG